jgi:carboxylesterase
MKKSFIMPTAEPFFIPGGKTGCLLLHGFTGTPKEMRMLGDALAKDGYTVLAPRLFGHATDPEDMRRARWQDWVACVEDGYHILKGCTERQVVMGLSMGGVLTLIAASRLPFVGAVTFSALSSLPKDPRRALLPLLGPLNLHVSKGKSDWHNADAAKDHVDYPYYPTRPVLELEKLIDQMHVALPQISCPVLLVQSHQDTTIPPTSMDDLYQQIGSAHKNRFWVENSGHVIIREPDREAIFAEVSRFMQQVLA